ncbi:NPP1 family protein [Pseudoalteromonas fenneropenaei]|uniref:NPP1 family protein n=1 Tax=Pseudoalteromonas fenneropenaei TaxID=1737459 RepID=A0ABV7CM47_9GAMM
MRLLTLLIATPYCFATDFAALPEALPAPWVINSTEPVFDFDGDGCLPSAGINQSGIANPGLNPSGRLTSDCRDNAFLQTSNTLHRYACTTNHKGQFCGHFYALYFKKDQVFDYLGGGHRHDWEYAAVWTIDGIVTHGSYSAHGKLYSKAASELPFENNHLKIVYHKDGLLTHAMRFAKPMESAENSYNRFVTPPIISWYHMRTASLDNSQLRTLLNQFDYGSATIPLKDSHFLSNLNQFRPAGYPEFSQEDVLSSR